MSAVLKERGVERKEIRKVIAHAESTGIKFVNRVTLHYLASLQLETMRYWVEFEQEGDAYRVYCAYSHRMQILESFGRPSNKKSKHWFCVKCNRFLRNAAVKLSYLGETFIADLPACPSCRLAFISEETAVENMAVAEKALEDK